MINACKSCQTRFGKEGSDVNITNCCYEICKSLDVINDTCFNQCKTCTPTSDIIIPSFTPFNNYKKCLDTNSNKPVTCCFDSCLTDNICKQQCMDMHNALLVEDNSFFKIYFMYIKWIILLLSIILLMISTKK